MLEQASLRGKVWLRQTMDVLSQLVSIKSPSDEIGPQFTFA